MADFQPVFVIHYHEIALKGRNRWRFEQQLVDNIKKTLNGLPFQSVRHRSGRVLVIPAVEAPLDEVSKRLLYVFGTAYFAPALFTPQTLVAMQEAAWQLCQERVFGSFKVDTRRAQKRFPLTSPEINAQVGAYLKERSQAAVDLSHPDLTCYIEVAERFALVYTEKIRGPGGLPVGVSERAVSLLSSGIDSPVASYKLMKRGVQLIFVHFHSHPYTSYASKRNTEYLVRVLTEYQFTSRVYMVPFINIQKQIMLHSPASYRVILYRRAMLRIAEAIAVKERARALITGENVGQVASQTLTNIRAIDEAAKLPVLRPLAGDDKTEIMALARDIGTYEISIEPYEDCCSLFVPDQPETRAHLGRVKAVEARLALAPLLEEAVQQAEVKTIER